MKLRILRYSLLLSLVFGIAFLLRAALPTVPTGTWDAAGNLSSARAGACTVVLGDGRLLVSGGTDANGPTNSADLFSTTGTWSAAPSMNSARAHHSCAVLRDGRVLVAGGTTSGGGLTNSVELYDPSADSWTHAGIMNDARSGATASVLQDGRVLIAGGQGSGAALNTLEIFDPAVGTFSNAGVMPSPRQDHASAVLSDGRVLIAGGSSDGANALNTTEIYDPQGGTISAGPVMLTARAKHTATTLLDGTVAVIGGSDYSNDLASVEVFDPAANSFTTASALATLRSKHSAFLLPNNNEVLVVGGQSAGADLASAELYIPWQKNFQATGAMTTPRSDATGAALTAADGYLLMAGGTAVSSAELYAFPTVKTDAADYAPGTIVNITGSGWQPGETVTLTLVESPLIDTHPTLTTVADSSGNISNNQFSPDAHDVNVRFYLTAVGGQSGVQAQNTFTDAAGDTVSTTVSCSLNSVTAGSPTTCTATVQNTQTGAPNGFPQGAVTFQYSGTPGTFSLTGNPCALSQVGSTNTAKCSVTLTADAVGTANVKGNFNSADQNKWKNDTSSNFLLTVSTGTFSQLQLLVPGEIAAPGTTTGKTGLPNTQTAGTVFNVTVNAVDANWNLVGTTNVVQITSSDPNATLPASAALVGGTKTFGVTLKTTPSQTITASDVTDGTKLPSTSPSIPLNAATANKLVFGQQPTDANVSTTIAPPITVQVKDAFGNIVTSSSASIALSIKAGTGTSGATLACTSGLSHNASSGIATFSDCNINKSGTNYQLQGTSSSLTTADSNTFSIISPISKLAFTTAPLTGAVNQCLGPITVQTQNSGGTGINPSTVVQVDLSITSGGTGAFYSDNSCNTGITNVSIPTSANSTNFFFKGTSAGSPVVQAADHAGVLTFATQTEAINQASTTTTVSSSLNPSTYGASPTFTANVATASGSTVPTGTVQFKIDGVSVGLPLSVSACSPSPDACASFTPTAAQLPVAGSPHSITAVYSGDATFLSSTSTALLQNVNNASTTTALSSSANPSASGQSVTFTASVTINSPGSGSIPSGETVTFKDGTTTLGTGTTNASGVATLATSTLSVGTHSITAVYAGDTNFATSTSSPVSQVINAASTATALTSSVNPSVFGQPVTFTATVTINSPGTGTISSGEAVTFKDGTTTLGIGTTNASGVATFAASTLSVATHSITAVYAGDTNFATSTSSAVSQAVNAAATTTSILAPNVTYPANATITVTVSSTAGTPGGNVSLSVDNGTPLIQPLTNGVATFTLTSPNGGSHSLSASYAAQGNFAASSGTGSLSVGQATPTVTFTGAPTQAAFGLQFPVAATTNASTTATITASGACTISGNTVTMTSGIGTCSLQAGWAADTNYVAATTTQSTSALPAPVSVTVPVTTVTYDGSPKSVTPTVTPVVPFTLTYTGISPTVYATSASAPTEPGSYTAVAAVIGPNYQGGSSGTLTINKRDPALQLALLSGMPDTTSYGSPVYFELTTATSPCPTGQVDFFVDGGATSSLTVALSDSPCTHQPIQFSTATLTPGSHSVSAVYSGDAHYVNRTSAPVLHTVVADTTTVTLASSVTRIFVGDSFTLTATVTPDKSVDASAATPTGKVEFYDNTTTPLGESPLSASGSAFVAVLTVPTLPAGSHSITATYVSADGDFLGNSSPVSMETVDKIAPAITWPNPADIVYGTKLDKTQLNATAEDTHNNITVPGTFVYDPLADTVLPVGTRNISVTFTPANSNTYTTQTATATITVTPATLTVTADNASRTYGADNPTFTFQYSGFVNGETLSLVSTAPTCSSTATATSPASPPTYPISCSGGAAPNYSFTYVDGALTITKATPTVTVTDPMPTYDGSPHSVTASVTGVGGAAVTGTFAFTYDGKADAPTDAKTSYAVIATFTSTDPNYTGATGNGSLTIKQATPIVTVADPAPTYDGTPHSATATVKGVGGVAVNGSFSFTYDGSATAPTNAKTSYPVVAMFTSKDPNYTDATGNGILTIKQATPTVTVIDPMPTFDGSPHSATATAKGVGGVAVNGSFSFTYDGSATAPTSAKTYTVLTSFSSSDSNYTDAIGNGALTIKQATPLVTVIDPMPTFDGSPHSATATAKGVGGAIVTGNFSFTYDGSGTAPTNAKTYTVVATFASSDSNYTDATGNGTLTIKQATPVVTVTDPAPTYDGNAHSAMATAKGIGGGAVTGNFTFTYDGSATAPKNAQTSYAVVATFTSGDSNYTGAIGNGTLTIKQATPIVMVTDPAPTYDGAPHSAAAIAKGVGGAEVIGNFAFTYDGSATAPTYARTSYPVVAMFTSKDPNYTDANGNGTLTIKQATPLVTVTDPAPTYDGTPHSATAIAKGVGGAEVIGNFAFTYDTNPAAPTYAKISYAVVATFTSTDPNYTGAIGNGILTIKQATPTVTVTDPMPTFDSNPHSAAATAKGVGGAVLTGTFTFTYDGNTTAPTNAKTSYAVVATFTSGDPNYIGASGNGILTIKQATPTVTVADPAPTYDGTPHSAIATAKGVGGVVLTGTFTYTYDGNASAPINAKTSYAVVATFASTNDSNYGGAMGNGTLTIKQAISTTVVTGGSFTYDGTPHPATVSVTLPGNQSLSPAPVYSGTCTTAPVNVPDTPCIASYTYAGDANHTGSNGSATITITKASQMITWANPATMLFGTALSGTQLNATVAGVAGGSAPGALTYSPAAGTILPASTQTLRVDAAATANYNAASKTVSIKVLYSTGVCDGDYGHQILQPINSDGTSVFKQKSTVPAKFRVCDAAGTSIGTPGVVSNFRLLQTISGTGVIIDESVDSTTPDSSFRWDPTAQQWIFNMNTKSLSANLTYYYIITLNDGSNIQFNFGLK